MTDTISNTARAAIAYGDALNTARNTQNALFRQYGFTMPSADGTYSVEAGQTAFDPNNLFNKDTGLVDEAKVKDLASKLSIGGTGILSDIERQGADVEAEMVAQTRSQLGGAGGGIMGQRRALAEAQADKRLQAGKEQFLAGVGQAEAPIGQAFANLQEAKILDKATTETGVALESTIAEPIDINALNEPKPSAGRKPPKQYQRRTNQYGVKQQFINGKWRKVK